MPHHWSVIVFDWDNKNIKNKKKIIIKKKDIELTLHIDFRYIAICENVSISFCFFFLTNSASCHYVGIFGKYYSFSNNTFDTTVMFDFYYTKNVNAFIP